MAGAGRFAREAATVLQREGFRVVLVDTRYAHVQQARSAGLSACYASILSEHLLDTVDFSDLGRFLALTSSDELNTLAAATFSDVFGRQHVYQLTPAPAEIELTINNERHKLPYENAFALGCSLLEKGQPEQAIKVFEKLEPFTDRGPRAFILRAFCEAAVQHFSECSAVLSQAFAEESLEVGAVLHDAFVFYHVASRQEALKQLADLVNRHHELPTLCLLLGDLLAGDNSPLARKCWKLAVRRDRPDGAVAAVAKQRLARETQA